MNSFCSLNKNILFHIRALAGMVRAFFMLLRQPLKEIQIEVAESLIVVHMDSLVDAVNARQVLLS